MPILSAVPTAIESPEISYDRLGVQLAVSPIWQEKDVRGTLALRVIPYRVLPDGRVDKREDLARSVSIGDIFEEATKDPSFATAMDQVWTALQAYILAKGV